MNFPSENEFFDALQKLKIEGMSRQEMIFKSGKDKSNWSFWMKRQHPPAPEVRASILASLGVDIYTESKKDKPQSKPMQDVLISKIGSKLKEWRHCWGELEEEERADIQSGLKTAFGRSLGQEIVMYLREEADLGADMESALKKCILRKHKNAA